MINIQACKNDVEDIISIVRYSFEIDAAVFDTESRLIACTDEYLRRKGNIVHAPSIEEVIANGNVVVNKPGYMQSCTGCRFIGDCPAKIEILKSICSGSSEFGVMTLTSFTREGHEKMTRQLTTFVKVLNIFTQWIAKVLLQKQKLSMMEETRVLVENFMNFSQEGILVASPDGSVVQCNSRAGRLFSFCDLHVGNIYHILPAGIADKALKANLLKNIKAEIANKQVFVSASPVVVNDELKSIVFFIREKNCPDVKAAREQTGPDKNDSISDLLGQSPEILKLKQNILKFAKSFSTILLTGETGTGKGLVARLIHRHSARSAGPFISVNCASIPENLFESELFGYEEGAFTGAKKGGKKGRFELAQGGTLFLDEIGEMPLQMQVKLLNVLQDHSFQKVGGVTQVSSDVRIIAATNQDMEEMIAKKRFRPDLFYRLNVIPMSLPPLRDREGDIDILAYFFLKEACGKSGFSIKKISEPVMRIFRDCDWPGNIRELQNVIEYSINVEETDTITIESLPDNFSTHFTGKSKSGMNSGLSQDMNVAISRDIRSKILDSEMQIIMSCLDRHGHGVAGKALTARELGISLRTLYRKLAKNT